MAEMTRPPFMITYEERRRTRHAERRRCINRVCERCWKRESKVKETHMGWAHVTEEGHFLYPCPAGPLHAEIDREKRRKSRKPRRRRRP